MRIEEEASDLVLHTPTFSCDSPYANVPSPLPKAHFFMALVGPPRSGKSSMATALLCQEKPRLLSQCFHHVYILVPKGSFESMVDCPYKDLPTIAHEFNAAVLDEIIELCQTASKKKQESLLMIDDFMTNLKDNSLRKQLEKTVANRRHLKLSVMVLSQTYNAMPLSTRKLLSHMALFRSPNLKENENIRNELINRDRSEWDAVYRHVFHQGCDPHAFIWIDVLNGELFNGFSRLKIVHGGTDSDAEIKIASPSK